MLWRPAASLLRRGVWLTPSRRQHQLVLLRHGQSEWNAQKRFTGWVDVDLTEQGREEAIHSGIMLKRHGFEFDEAHTSLLKRAARLPRRRANRFRESFDRAPSEPFSSLDARHLSLAPAPLVRACAPRVMDGWMRCRVA